MKMEQQCLYLIGPVSRHLLKRRQEREKLAPIQQVRMNRVERDGTLSLMCIAEWSPICS